MIRKSLLASLVILGSTLAVTSTAQAAEETVIFNGSVPDSCVIDGKTDGNLGLDASGQVLDSTAPDGLTGTVTITCAGPAALTISAPAPTTSPTDYNDASSIKTVTVSGAGLGANISVLGVAAGTGVIPLGGTNTLDVDMTATMTGGLPQGDYTFGVTVTAVSL
ncbi:MAG: hypothetical protein WA919_23865 [Coleofasciculaceae cyanobacterium]